VTVAILPLIIVCAPIGANTDIYWIYRFYQEGIGIFFPVWMFIRLQVGISGILAAQTMERLRVGTLVLASINILQFVLFLFTFPFTIWIIIDIWGKVTGGK